MFDEQIDLFEGQYPVPEGVTYNTRVILDEKCALMDTVDARATGPWLEELATVLNGRTLDYLVISHMEPDHSGSVTALVHTYPDVTLVGNAKTFVFLDQFTGGALRDTKRMTVVNDGTLCLGETTLRFIFAPMVHWPEVMVSFATPQNALFAADAFGRFGDADPSSPFTDEARRYYCNIVGKYGPQVQGLMKKAAALPIETVYPLHGPVLRGEALSRALNLYQAWSTYTPEDDGVLIAYASFHGHTAEAASYSASCLEKMGIETTLLDLNRIHKSYAVAEAFRRKHIVLAANTYDGGFAPAMEQFLRSMAAKGVQGRRVALIENGTWAPMAAKLMRGLLETMKNMTVLENQVTLRSAMSEENKGQIEAMMEDLVRG